MSHQSISQNMTVITCHVPSAIKRKMAEEKNLENRIKTFLKKEECWCLKYWAGGGFTKSGIPDLLICCNGYFIGAELKASNGTPSELQIRELIRIQNASGIGVLVYPADEVTFRRLIKALKAFDMREAEALQKKLEDKVETWRKKYQIM